MSKLLKFFVGLLVVSLVFNCGAELAEAADNDSVLAGGFGLSSIDNDLRRLLKGITSLARPVVTIMTALAGMMVVLNIGGDHKQKIWNWILGIGLALNFGSVLWNMWGGYANIPAGRIAAAEYTFKIFGESNLTDGGIDTLSQMMKYLLTYVVAGAIAIKPIAIKLLLGLALADMSIRLALDITDKDKVSWLVKTFLKIGFYVFLIHNWLGIDGWNLMDMLSKGFQEIGFTAGNYGEAILVSTEDVNGTIDPKDNLAPDSIVNNMFKMFSMLYGSSLPQDASFMDKAVAAGKRYFSLVTSPVSSVLIALSLLIAVICAFLTAIEMFMARIEFYILALLAIPLLAFGVIKHFEYLAQNAIRAVFNCGVKVCVIAFLQAVICQMFTRYTFEIDKSLRAGPTGSSTGTSFELLSMTLQLLLMSIIMYLIVSKVPKLIQGLLAGNPSLGGSDMTGTVMGAAGTAAAGVGMYVGAHAAAVSARQDAANGKSVSAWKMSELGQMGAAMLRRAPITGTAFSAYQDVARFGSSGNDNQDKRKDTDTKLPPQNNYTKETPELNSPQNNDGTHVGKEGDQPSQAPINKGAAQQTSQQPGAQGMQKETPQQYVGKEGNQASQATHNEGAVQQASQQSGVQGMQKEAPFATATTRPSEENVMKPLTPPSVSTPPSSEKFNNNNGSSHIEKSGGASSLSRDEAKKEKMKPSSPPPASTPQQYQYRMPPRKEIDPTDNE